MFKINSILFAFIASFLLLGCGGEPQPVEDSNPTHTDTTKKPEDKTGEGQQAPVPSESSPASAVPEVSAAAPAEAPAVVPEATPVQAPARDSEGPSPNLEQIQVGTRYDCDGERAYILYEPGKTDPNFACELDALHTPNPVDWNARSERNYCRGILERRIARYNCAP